MIARLSVAAVLAALVLNPGPARAQNIVVNVDGPCVMDVGGRNSRCAGTAYIAFPATQRVDFVAVTIAGDWIFSGHKDDAAEGGLYTLVVDALTGPRKARAAAEGMCSMDLADDKVTVRSIDCVAITEADGPVQLRASGMVTQTVVSRRGDDSAKGIR